MGRNWTKTAADPAQKLIVFHGVVIPIEWPKGSIRQWENSDYRRPMFADYGYIRDTTGDDNEEIDVYVGDNLESTMVLEIEQLKDGQHDEMKYMIGYDTVEEAVASYLQHMDKEKLGQYFTIELPNFLEMLPKGVQKTAVDKSYVEMAYDLIQTQRFSENDIIGELMDKEGLDEQEAKRVYDTASRKLTNDRNNSGNFKFGCSKKMADYTQTGDTVQRLNSEDKGEVLQVRASAGFGNEALVKWENGKQEWVDESELSRLDSDKFGRRTSVLKIGHLVTVRIAKATYIVGQVKMIYADEIAKVTTAKGTTMLPISELTHVKVTFATEMQELDYLQQQMKQLKEDKKNTISDDESDAIGRRLEELEQEERKVNERMATSDPTFFGGVRTADPHTDRFNGAEKYVHQYPGLESFISDELDKFTDDAEIIKMLTQRFGLDAANAKEAFNLIAGQNVASLKQASDNDKELEEGNASTLRSPSTVEVSEEADDILEESHKEGFPGNGPEREIELSTEKKASCPPGMDKEIKDKVKDEYGENDPRTYKTLNTIRNKGEASKRASGAGPLTMGTSPVDTGEDTLTSMAGSEPGVGDVVTVQGTGEQGTIVGVGEDSYDVQMWLTNKVQTVTKDNCMVDGMSDPIQQSVEENKDQVSPIIGHKKTSEAVCNNCGAKGADYLIGGGCKECSKGTMKKAQVSVSESWSPDGTITRDIKFDEVNPQEAEALMSLINHAPEKSDDMEGMFEEEAMQSPADQGIDDNALPHTKSENADGSQENPPFKGSAMPGQSFGSKKMADEQIQVGDKVRMLIHPGQANDASTEAEVIRIDGNKAWVKGIYGEGTIPLENLEKLAGEGTHGFDVEKDKDEDVQEKYRQLYDEKDHVASKVAGLQEAITEFHEYQDKEYEDPSQRNREYDQKLKEIAQKNGITPEQLNHALFGKQADTQEASFTCPACQYSWFSGGDPTCPECGAQGDKKVVIARRKIARTYFEVGDKIKMGEGVGASSGKTGVIKDIDERNLGIMGNFVSYLIKFEDGTESWESNLQFRGQKVAAIEKEEGGPGSGKRPGKGGPKEISDDDVDTTIKYLQEGKYGSKSLATIYDKL